MTIRPFPFSGILWTVYPSTYGQHIRTNFGQIMMAETVNVKSLTHKLVYNKVLLPIYSHRAVAAPFFTLHTNAPTQQSPLYTHYK